MSNYIKGNVRKILFESNNGYKVGLFKIKETNSEEVSEYLDKTITFTGSFMPHNTELTYIFYGNLFNHSKYGVQFNVTSYDVCEPTGEEEIIMYLGSGLFKGIGLKTAKKIVDEFKENTLEEIKNGNSRLFLIKGLNEKKIENLINKVRELEKYNDLIVGLNSLGFSTEESMTLLTKYKERIKDILENNIYLLIEDVNFNKLDEMFLRSHDESDIRRLKAVTRHVIINGCYKTGNTLIHKESLYLSLKNYFKETISIEKYESLLRTLDEEEIIILKDDYVIEMSFYECEKTIARKVNILNKIKNQINEKSLDKEIKYFEKDNNIKFNDEQKEAIKLSIKNNLSIITGGPGTGKTTIIKAIVDIYTNLFELGPDDITLLAPTGRSAKRMSESVKKKASTIHKFLKWNKDDKTFQVNSANPSNTKIVIVDEVSMVDVFLFKSLLDGLKENVRLILVGDANQLPSIAPGNVLYDLISSDKINKVSLNTIYRAKEDSYIVTLASEVKNKKVFDKMEKYNDFSFVESEDADIRSYLKDICIKVKDKNIDVDAFQVLAPMYKGENGIDNINKLMQSIFNPGCDDKNEIVIRNIVYRENDKVLQLVNDVDNNIYNGDIGYIRKIFPGKNPLIQIDFMGNIVTFKKNKFDEFTHAYAISVHKSQGSEYDNVVLILANSFKRMLYNKLVYTGISRAKKTLVIIGSLENLNCSVHTEFSINRLTNLKNML